MHEREIRIARVFGQLLVSTDARARRGECVRSRREVRGAERQCFGVAPCLEQRNEVLDALGDVIPIRIDELG